MLDMWRKLSRWVRGGLYSLGTALIIFILAALAGIMGMEDIGQISIAGGAIAPFILFDMLSLPDTGIATTLMWIIGIGFWFGVGALLGKFTRRVRCACLLWVVIYIAASIFTDTLILHMG